MSGPPILIVDDDQKVVALVRAYLQRAGFAVIGAADGETAERLIRDEDPRLVVLDVMLPRLDGLSLLRSLRERHHPVALGGPDERLAGLVDGADDYVAKPFSPAELVERVSAILRRTEGPGTDVLTFRDLRIDLARHDLERDGARIELTLAEYRLLVALVRARGRVLSRDQLLDELHGMGEADVPGRSIDVHIARLRGKLGRDQHYVATVRGVGYRVVEDQT